MASTSTSNVIDGLLCFDETCFSWLKGDGDTSLEAGVAVILGGTCNGKYAMCGMATLSGGVVENMNVLMDHINGTPLIHNEEEDQVLETNVRIMAEVNKVGYPYQDIPKFAAPRVLGDMKNDGHYVWDRRAMRAYDSSGKTVSSSRTVQTAENVPSGEHDDTNVGTEIEVPKFTIRDYVDMDIWVTIFQICDVDTPLRDADMQHRNVLMENIRKVGFTSHSSTLSVANNSTRNKSIKKLRGIVSDQQWKDNTEIWFHA